MAQCGQPTLAPHYQMDSVLNSIKAPPQRRFDDYERSLRCRPGVCGVQQGSSAEECAVMKLFVNTFSYVRKEGKEVFLPLAKLGLSQDCCVSPLKLLDLS
ncbi:hypothetical protein AOLI_G00123470 [Acnodon oligacanthus]